MKRQHTYSFIVRCLLAVIFLLSLFSGCAHKEKKDETDQFFKQWKMTAEKSKGHSPKSRSRVIKLPPRVLTAQEAEKQEAQKNKPLPTKKITMRMHETDVTVLLRALTRAVGLNLVVNEGVKGTVNIDIKEAAWDQAFLSILNAQGLSYTWDGDIIRIVTQDDINRDLERLTTDQKIKSQKKDMELVEPLITQVVEVEFANANKLKDSLTMFLSEKEEGQPIGSVMVDDHTNSLIIQAIYSDLERMIPIILELDKPTPQVLIEAHIVEAAKGVSMELGVQWGGLYNSGDLWITPGANSSGVLGNTLSNGGIDPTSGDVFNSGGSNTITNATGATGLTLGLALEDIGGSILAAQLSALQAEGKLNILSSPSITTLDNQEAVIESGQEVPYQTVVDNEVNVEYKDAVLSLVVTPHVIGDNILKLNIKTTKDELDFVNAVRGQPAIDTKRASTNVLLYDGQTTVIAGLSKENSRKQNTGVPWLKEIPILGYLFQGKEDEDTLEELLIFITPHILGERFDGELDDPPAESAPES
ncbi:MAG: type IV pilus secretin PilQ [Deltaproteobacteria bacterium]|jgi:type IV pilus assembly protein PilQ|nr:type IV pilus secretin PilQ [Deltaproteobacteria bacterium]